MKLIAVLSAFLLPISVLARIGGPCSGSHHNNRCICLDRNECVNRYGGRAFEGTPGNYPCPSDPGNVWGCTVYDRCPGYGGDTGCVWTNIAPGCPSGRIIQDPVCPGPNEFVCCDVI
ncbi:hypothetical protein N657DRAFT_674725 [Parathielavia appendiculata]|uniref:Uncharacterized protein n=1 Tax=Parathielavia appendiculata TaxID=2587402 RepID=A0AAN6TSC1_9PEZI|nr:hypothetical protein N657DRAFT_674725 [Parathielavia appendiculata]